MKPVHRTQVCAGAAGRATGLGLLVAVWLAGAALAGDPGLRVRWAPDYTALRFEYAGRQLAYPQALQEGEFPPPGAPPRIETDKSWPTVAAVARWSVDKRSWPEALRRQALALVLMRVCDAGRYERVFPESIRRSRYLTPPPWRTAAEHAGEMPGWLRGRRIEYEVTADAGFAAADYEIRTTIRLGVSADGRTAFYHDLPSRITDHLVRREFLLAVHDTGDTLRFEVRLLCMCAPRRLFRGEALRRVAADTTYFISSIYRDLEHLPRAADLDEYLRVLERAASQPATASAPARHH